MEKRTSIIDILTFFTNSFQCFFFSFGDSSFGYNFVSLTLMTFITQKHEYWKKFTFYEAHPQK